MKYRVIGLMSGTSLDGLDIAICKFEKINFEKLDQTKYKTYAVTKCYPISYSDKKQKSKWTFEIEKVKTIKYPQEWQERLKNAHNLNAYELVKIDLEYGKFIGKQVKDFIKNDDKIDFIASHGHTIFHNPSENLTLQIGNGNTIAATSGLSVISDFRTMDIALGGQGAPLVPIGDKFLFSEYNYCLNLGGFANISYEKKGLRIAFDISPINFAANYFAQKLNLNFDDKGKIGEQGIINKKLLKELNNISFYKQEAPKSLSREWFFADFLPIVENYNISTNDKLRTIYEHAAYQIGKITNGINKKLLITGGGAYNSFLIILIKKYSNCKIIIPDSQIIDYKEAMIFAFLGVLRFRNEINCLSSVTGAKHDNIGGNITNNNL